MLCIKPKDGSQVAVPPLVDLELPMERGQARQRKRLQCLLAGWFCGLQGLEPGDVRPDGSINPSCSMLLPKIRLQLVKLTMPSVCRMLGGVGGSANRECTGSCAELQEPVASIWRLSGHAGRPPRKVWFT